MSATTFVQIPALWRLQGLLGAALLLGACTPEWKAVDADGDGVDALKDCWDNPVGPTSATGTTLTGAEIFPGAPDAWYDGIDADCAGDDDFDADLDGFVPDAYADVTTLPFDLPVLPAGDCWDSDDPEVIPPEFVALNALDQPLPAEVNPSGTDSFYDGVDEDCAQQVADCDADCQAQAEFDADGDGYDSAYQQRRDGSFGDDCFDHPEDSYDNPAGLSELDTHPGSIETWYDGSDQDCANDDDWDQDQDGHECEELPDGAGSCLGDCDDTDPARYPDPSVTEVWYDGVDANCDGHSDFDQDFDDSDSEAWGGADCADEDASIFPEATEDWYDGVDQNCDRANDWDADSDGYTSLYQPDGDGVYGTDCYDQVGDSFDDPGAIGPAGIYPGSVDSWYDGTDQDCDGASDYDQDGDGQDRDSDGGSDCNDRDAAIREGVLEDCSTGDDDNCDGSLDQQEAVGCVDWYLDDDGDGHGDPALSECWCEAQVVTSFTAAGSAADDCDDGAAGTYPGAPELCDLADVDEDCDGLSDDADTGATGGSTYYLDDDGDGQGDETDAGVVLCDGEAGRVSTSTDCDDADAAIYFGAQEICDGANVDEDCDDDADDADISVDISTESTWYTDADGDSFGDPATETDRCDAPARGVADGTDCDDGDSAIHPDAIELCDAANTDEDCDGLADDAAPEADGKLDSYADADGDGQGAGAVVPWCDRPAGYSADNLDCNDGDDEVYDGAPELCTTGADDDCDGDSNEASSIDASTWYADNDGDGYGDPTETQPACVQPVGYVADFGDCNDLFASAFPGATEFCNFRDDDCDGASDENSAVDASTWYFDGDNDSYGNSGDTTVACIAPSNFVSRGEDCDDSVTSVNPAATERCSTAADDDCDGSVNEDDAFGTTTFYADTDGDGYGDLGNTYSACTVPSGYTTDTRDCNDEDNLAYPGATERCATAYDDDCDGAINEAGAVGTAFYYRDADGDGFGDEDDLTATEGCSLIPGEISNNDDCDDTRAAVNPDEDEVCSTAYDDDCDGSINENGAADATAYYDDNDGDGYGDEDDTALVYSCTAVSGDVTDSTDCDDAQVNANPGETETCTTAYDDDCDGTANAVGTADGTLFYVDIDGDSYGAATGGIRYCATTVAGRVANNTDCNDSNAGISPGDLERCDTTYDDDCDSSINEDGAVGAVTYYRDSDSDTYGNASDTRVACLLPSGYVANSTDCSDTNNAAYPGAPELCATYGTDNDCDGSTTDATDELTWYYDSDLDTYAGATTQLACTDPGTRYYATSTDCNDSDSAVYPSAIETCANEGTDNDCSSSTRTPVDRLSWYADTDSDTYGAGTATLACTAPSAHVANNTDCNNNNAAISPGATEVCDASDTDEDCDGLADDADASATGETTWYRDQDGDTQGTTATTSVLCNQPSGYVGNSTDCNDNNAAIYVGATEVCDALDTDEDCDGFADDADPGATGETDWYADADGDSFGDETDVPTSACNAPTATVADNTDCDDSDSWVYPGAPIYCDGVDNDCDPASESETGVVTGIDSDGEPVTMSWSTNSAAPTDDTLVGEEVTINVCAGTYYVNLTVPDATAEVDVALVGLSSGANPVLSGLNNQGSILRVIAQTSAHTISLENLTLEAGVGTEVGTSTYMGGAIYVTALTNPSVANVTLTGCELSDNDLSATGTSYGGAIAIGGLSGAARSGKVALVDTTVELNAASYGGAFYLESGVVTMSCTGGGGVERNDALVGFGGAAEFGVGATSSFTVTSCDLGAIGNDNGPHDFAQGGTLDDYDGVSSFVCTGGGALSCVP